MFKDATTQEIENAMKQAWKAFESYREYPLAARKQFMNLIADNLEYSGDEIIKTAMSETNLPEERLINERNRTVFQLRQYGAACAEGSWLDVRIDTQDKELHRPDLRKTKIPLGPVVVFGSSNFPFAYSTAGGDTACALAAGCPVIVKAHPAHPKTSQMVATIITEAAQSLQLPNCIFTHLFGADYNISKALVMHPLTKAVGFTGSFTGGKQLFDWAGEREEPIPVFAEMGSTNPVFLLPQKMKAEAKTIAHQLSASMTVGVGQFCTNPGLIIAIENDSLTSFNQTMKEAIQKVAPQKMLHSGIAKAFDAKSKEALHQTGVSVMAESKVENNIHEGRPVVATVSAQDFISNPYLREEVFGPFSLIIRCRDEQDMLAVASAMKGQLTASVMGTTEEIQQQSRLMSTIKNICGRLIFNGVPTGVAVCNAMQHGGPFPATTDSRFTSVGPDGISRFVRPVAYQNCPDELLPDELKNENPLKIWRMVNGSLTKDAMD